jgi:hypothetical protein
MLIRTLNWKLFYNIISKFLQFMIDNNLNPKDISPKIIEDFLDEN